MRTVEEIRKTLTMSQAQFADQLNMSKRSYTNKLNGTTEWTLSELRDIAAYNEGEIRVNIGDDIFDITIKEG